MYNIMNRDCHNGLAITKAEAAEPRHRYLLHDQSL